MGCAMRLTNIYIYSMSCGFTVIIGVHHSMQSLVMWNYMCPTPIICSGFRLVSKSKKSKTCVTRSTLRWGGKRLHYTFSVGDTRPRFTISLEQDT